jgi:hypothetical protein
MNQGAFLMRGLAETSQVKRALGRLALYVFVNRHAIALGKDAPRTRLIERIWP